jgi:hypothetical protein
MSNYSKRQLKNWKGKQRKLRRLKRTEKIKRLFNIKPDEQSNKYKQP